MLVVLVELLSFTVLKIRDNPQPFLVDRKAAGVRTVGKTTELSYIDPHLGHARDPETIDGLGEVPGFAVYGDDHESDQELRIFALGGSTTDPNDPNNWPKQLHEVLRSNGIEARVFNGGVSGYSSNQELLKMIRDVLPLEPDIIICLNGLNDLGFCQSVPGHPMVHPYQEALLRSITDKKPYLFPSTSHVIGRLLNRLSISNKQVTGMNLGTSVQTTPAEQWERNIRIMRAVAEEFGVEYICFLQPCMGVGEYSPTPEEEEMFRFSIENRKGNYIAQITEFYQHTRETSSQLYFCTDLTNIMSGGTDLYRDARHPNAKGYRVIAEAVFVELNSRGMFDREVNTRTAILADGIDPEITREEE